MRFKPAGRFIELGVLAALIILCGLILPSAYYYRVGTLVLISGIAALGLNLLLGYAGQISLGHAGFVGIGAYAVALLPAQLGMPPFVALIVGAGFSGLLALVIGRSILKLKDHFLAVATLGLGILVAMVLTNEADLTGGPDGIPVARLVVFGERLRTPQTWFWICGFTFLVGAYLLQNLLNSSTGRALRALHDSEVAARAAGVDVARMKAVVFVISAIYASISGSLFALFNGHVTPNVASFLNSIELVAMVVLGGMGSLSGSLAGAAVLVVLPQVLTVFHEYEQLLLGVLIVLILIFMRAGIVPTLIGWLARRPS